MLPTMAAASTDIRFHGISVALVIFFYCLTSTAGLYQPLSVSPGEWMLSGRSER